MRRLRAVAVPAAALVLAACAPETPPRRAAVSDAGSSAAPATATAPQPSANRGGARAIESARNAVPAGDIPARDGGSANPLAPSPTTVGSATAGSHAALGEVAAGELANGTKWSLSVDTPDGLCLTLRKEHRPKPDGTQGAGSSSGCFTMPFAKAESVDVDYRLIVGLVTREAERVVVHHEGGVTYSTRPVAHGAGFAPVYYGVSVDPWLFVTHMTAHDAAGKEIARIDFDPKLEKIARDMVYEDEDDEDEDDR